MQKLISNMLRKIADNLDAGTSHLDEKVCRKVLDTINLIFSVMFYDQPAGLKL